MTTSLFRWWWSYPQMTIHPLKFDRKLINYATCQIWKHKFNYGCGRRHSPFDENRSATDRPLMSLRNIPAMAMLCWWETRPFSLSAIKLFYNRFSKRFIFWWKLIWLVRYAVKYPICWRSSLTFQCLSPVKRVAWHAFHRMEYDFRFTDDSIDKNSLPSVWWNDSTCRMHHGKR